MPILSLPGKRRPVRYNVLPSGCWEWDDTKSGNGYGYCWIQGKYRGAHRVLYEHFRGAIPEGFDVDHLCRNTLCVNPDHLEPVTHAENLARGLRGRMYTHCKYGHPFTPENTYNRPDRPHGSGRLCRTCRRISNADAKRTLEKT